MTDRDEMIERANNYFSTYSERSHDEEVPEGCFTLEDFAADFALAEIARAEADLRARLVAEIEVGRGPESTQWNMALDTCIEIVRGESKES